MIHVSVNYLAPQSEENPDPLARLRSVTWLVENASHLRKLGESGGERLQLVFVGHTQHLTPALIEELSETCTVRIETPLYERLCAEYPGLVAAQGGPYKLFTFGFLRWLLIARLFGAEPVLCYDGDILHNMPLPALSSAFRGITRTSTSTAFAAISDPAWFTAWARNLAAFDRDPASFLNKHAFRLPFGPGSFRTSPEEYFAKFLIESGELPQDELDASFPFWIVPQPHILPRLYNFVETRALNAVPTPMKYERAWGADMLNGRPLAFWHMQKPFMSQLSSLAVFREGNQQHDPGRIHNFNYYGSPGVDERVRLADPYHLRGGYGSVPKELVGLAQGLIDAEKRNTAQQITPERNLFHPAFLYDYYFRRFDFSILFNNRRWPRPGVWQNPQPGGAAR